jgi:photosystem II stability/assembly factor-like uncharacterized protein
MIRFSRATIWILFLLAIQSPGGLMAQWSKVSNITGPEDQRIGAICFSDGIVWAGATSLFSSTDSGKTWSQSANFPSSEISDIAFYDSLNGLVGTHGSGVFLTQDGGQSWTNAVLSSGQPYCRVAFNGSASIMHALDNNGIINSSSDGGLTWRMQNFGGEGLTFAIGADKTIYVFTSGTTGWVNSSTDLGTTWSGNGGGTDADSQGIAADSCDIHKLYLINENTRNGPPSGNLTTKIDITPDGGQTWQTNSSHKLDYYSGSIANTAQVVYITTDVGGKGVLRSTDAGASWQSIGGPMCYFDTRSIALANNNIVFVLDSNGSVWTTLNSGGTPLDLGASTRGNPMLVVSSNPLSLQENTCGPLDTSIALNVLSCRPASAELDSAWITGSSSFSRPCDCPPTPLLLSPGDAIPLRFWPGSLGHDTAYLHLAYRLAGVSRDTTILLLGASLSKGTNSAGAQREVVSSSYGASANLRLFVNVQPSINIDSIWPYLKSMDAQFSYDSSQLSFSSYNPPADWSTISSQNLGNAIEINIRNVSSLAAHPLDLGTANFLPRLHTSSLTKLPLTYLVLNTSGGQIPLCIDRQEDDIWAIEVYPTSDVAKDNAQEQDIQVFPNPADNELWIRNSTNSPALVKLSDALGRELLSESVPENSTGRLDIESLPSSSYILTCHVNDRTFIRRVAKLR